MSIKVSVVVPVYNAGPYLEPCANSLLDQTMPATELELIFVNDGSTDDSLDQLQAMAAEHSHVRVITIPNSGWPGKPRNVGTDAATGEYVMYVDQDDALTPDALHRMYQTGAANAADVVLGKVTSDFRPVNLEVYRTSRPHCDVYSAELMNSLTPHKMLRRQLLAEHHIRYPEGRRRLEDQLFMTRAYFAATAASIVADYVCYRYQRRADGANAGSKRIDPTGYYANLREVLDVVDASTAPGPQRDHFYRRFLRTEMLGKLSGRDVLRAPPDYLDSLLGEIRRLLESRFPASVDAGLGVGLRGRAALVRAGTIEQVARQAAVAAEISPRPRVVAVRLLDGRFEVDLETQLYGGDQPVMLEPSPVGWLAPTSLAGELLSEEERRVEDPADMVGDLVARHRTLLDEWFMRPPLTARVEPASGSGVVAWSGTAVVDTAVGAAGGPLPAGIYDFSVRTRALGLSRTKRLPTDPIPDSTLPLLIDASGQICRLYVTEQHNLSIEVGASTKRLTERLKTTTMTVDENHGLVLVLGVVWLASPPEITLSLTSPQRKDVRWPLQRMEPASARWLARPPAASAFLKDGLYDCTLHLFNRGTGKTTRTSLASQLRVDSAMRKAWLAAAVKRVWRRSDPRSHEAPLSPARTGGVVVGGLPGPD